MKNVNHMRGAAALLATCIFGGTAMAAPTVVMNNGAFQNTNFASGMHQVGLFVPTLTVTDWPPPGGNADEQPNSVLFEAKEFTAGEVYAAFVGNQLDIFPPPPIATPGFLLEGGLRIEGWSIDASKQIRLPTYDNSSGVANPASISQNGTAGSFQLDSFNPGEYAYLGYTRSDARQFGYVQYQCVSTFEWRLIGYSYGGIDEAVTVINLVPSPGALGALGAGLLRRQRRCSK
jgi:hypothetical protein